MSYLLDTNIFIQCKNEMPMDIFLGFWQKLAELACKGYIFSSVKVMDEICRGNDDLERWCKDNLPKGFFLQFDANTEYSRLMQWTNGNSTFSSAAKQQFAIVADAFIVATAAAHDMKVVTFEKSDPNSKRRVKIPDACLAMGVEYCSLNDLFHELKVTI